MVKDVLTFSKQRVELQIKAVMCAFRLTKRNYLQNTIKYENTTTMHMPTFFCLVLCFLLVTEQSGPQEMLIKTLITQGTETSLLTL